MQIEKAICQGHMQISARETGSWRLPSAGFLDGGENLLGVGVIRFQAECYSQLLFSFFQVSGTEVHPSEVFVQMRGLRAGAAELHGLLNLCERLRPILRVGRREREVSELLHTVRNLLILLELFIAILILLRFGIVRFLQSARQIVESLRIVGV